MIVTKQNQKSAYRADLLTNGLGFLNLLDIRGGGSQGIRQALNGQPAHTRPDSKGFDSVGPEELVTEEGMDNSRNARCEGRQYLDFHPERT